MKLFNEFEILDAYAHAEAGGQALHLFGDPGVYQGSSACFKRSRLAAHLIDYDIGRLKLTASKLGVRRIVISRVGQRGQHIDLCGRPLIRALCTAHSVNSVPSVANR
jgi:hypothetical protein